MPRPQDLTQRDPMTARLFLVAALVWPLCLWALFCASAPTAVDRRLSNTTTPSSLKLSFRNVLDRVDVVGFGPTHPRVAAVVTGTSVEEVRHTVDSLFAHTTLDRVFCVVAVMSHMETSETVEKKITGSHLSHKVHVLFGDSTRQDGVEFVRILSTTHEEEGLKSVEEDLILVLLQSGTSFTTKNWLAEVTQALIVPPPLGMGHDEVTVSQKLANAVALDKQRVGFDVNLTPLVVQATAAEIAASNGASWSAPVAWGGIALRLPTYLHLPLQQNSPINDPWVAQLELSLQLWLCGDGVDSLEGVYVEHAPSLPTEPTSLKSTAHVASTFLDGRSQKLWFLAYQQHNSEVTFLDWQTALAQAARESGFAGIISSRCRSMEWYSETVNQETRKVWEVAEEAKTSSDSTEAAPSVKKEDPAASIKKQDPKMDSADGPDLSVPLHPPPAQEEGGPDLSVPIHAAVKKPTKPLCDECLQIVQKATPYDIQFVDVSNGYKEHPHMGALDAEGKPGYVHDETALRKSPPPPLTETVDSAELYNACSKHDNNYRMLTEKVFVDTAYDKAQAGKERPKIFCLVYTISPFHSAIPNIRSTWGPKCDGFMVGSNLTDASLGTVNILHEGPELYKNIWQKVRSMWSYIYDHYYDKYDFFHIGGDDLYVLVENLRLYLESEEIQTAQNGGVYLPNGDEKVQTPLFLGRRFAYWGDRNNIFNSGGSGYTLNKAALKLLVVDGLPNLYQHLKDFSEDTRIAQIFRRYGVFPYDTKDEAGGERYMPFMPGHHYGYRMPSDKSKDWYASYSIDIKEGADHCAARSVAFHYVKGFSMIKLHALLYEVEDSGSTTMDGDTTESNEHLFVNCDNGDDRNSGASTVFPLRTLWKAQSMARNISDQVTVGICGTCYTSRKKHFTLTEADSDTTWKKWDGCKAAVLSGGSLLKGLSWSRFSKSVYVASLPNATNVSAVDGLFAILPGANEQVRLVRARYPNGNPEVDRMPQGYDKLSGGIRSVRSWEIAGNVSQRFPVSRNSSFYPWFGHSRDIRWVQDYHSENASSYYGRAHQFWRPTIASEVAYNNIGKMRQWKAEKHSEAVMHVIHYDWWGNWQWKIRSMSNTTIELGEGGWQDAHGGPISHNYFYVENLLSELDSPGEWYVDRNERKLYYYPLKDQCNLPPSSWVFVATQAPTVLLIQGTSHLHPVRNINVDGLTFAHTTTTFLEDRYIVPSAGDWSVLPQGAVTIRDATDVSLLGCTWHQVNGNGVALRGFVRNSVIADGDFQRIGDSGVVVLGELNLTMPYMETDSVPTNITITRCHFGQTGVFGKQTAALFVAVSRRVRFSDNVLYDGSRSGININDGFGGGHILARNIIFNQVLESGDHGPINTWSRSAYKQVINGQLSTTPEWNRIDQNFIMIGPKFGSLYGPGKGPCSNGDPKFYCDKGGGSLISCLDHDDGSSYFVNTKNVCVFAGMKSYIGENKIWDSNLIVYPEGALSQNRSLGSTSCIWTSMNMGGNQSLLPCSFEPCRTQEVYTNNACVTSHSYPLEYDSFNQTDLKLMGNRNTTIPFTANNTYYLKHGYHFGPSDWNFSATKRNGIDISSRVFGELGPASLKRLVQEWIRSANQTGFFSTGSMTDEGVSNW